MLADNVTREIFGNIDWLSKAVFYALATVSLICFAYGIWRRIQVWQLGRPTDEKIDWFVSLRRLLVKVISQRTLRGFRPKATRAHRMLFWGFLILFIGTVLVAIEHGFSTVLNRSPTDPVFHHGLYYAVFEATLDAAGLVFLVGCGWFAVRRIRSADSMAHRTSDGIVLALFFILGISGFLVEGARIIREATPSPGISFVGFGCAKLLSAVGIDAQSATTLHFALWWFHAVAALSLIAAFPFCRLMHAVAGAINLAITSHQPGSMVQISIESVEETGEVGVGSIDQFTRRQLLQLDACVSCGRCEDACPAYEAGKPLSPRDLVQDLRHHLYDSPARSNRVDGTSANALHGDVIEAETLWSCTTCHACLDVCPLDVSPIQLITDMRRHLIGEGELRGSPAASLQKMQRSGNPWGLPPEDRFNWAAGLDVPTVMERPDFEILYWVGCAASYDRRTQKVARAIVKLLNAANVKFAVLGSDERCTGESARRMGDEFLFQELATANITALNDRRVTRIVTHCPHCLNSFKNDYPQFGGQYKVQHHSQLLRELIEDGRLPIDQAEVQSVTYHDPCYLARVNDISQSPRKLIQLTMSSDKQDGFVEMPRNRRNTSCCGAGGGRMWFDDSPDQRIGSSRTREVIETGADKVAVSCPFCLRMLSDGLAAEDANVQVQDIAELLVESLEREKNESSEPIDTNE